jgi:hypothetical protein
MYHDVRVASSSIENGLLVRLVMPIFGDETAYIGLHAKPAINWPPTTKVESGLIGGDRISQPVHLAVWREE